MILFHFSGTPGTGKSYLCGLISKILQKEFATFDTDNWLDEWHNNGALKAHSGRQARDMYEKFINAKIAKFEAEKTKWILCGVLNYEFTVRGRLLRMPVLNWPDHTKKVFISINTDKLYKQRAVRALQYICKHKDEIEGELDRGDEVIIHWELSEPKEYVRKIYQFDLEYHLQHGYVLKTQVQALDMVKRFLGKN